MLLLKKFQIKSEFIPVTIFSGITLLMYIGGLLHVLSYTILLITGLGTLCLLWILCINRITLADLKKLFTPGMAIFVVACALLFFTYQHARLTRNDDFSHWALIVKQIAKEGRLPDSMTPLITFQSYPPGSALFIYYIIRILGYGFDLNIVEGKMLFAQGMLIFSCLLTLFSLIQTRRKVLYGISIVVILVASVFLLTLEMPLNTLVVDTLLPLVALANTVILIGYRNDIKRAALLSIPLMVLTLLVKNTGIFFFAVNAVLLLILAIRAKGMQRLGLAVAGIAVPILMLLLWHNHVHLNFDNNTGMHAIDFERYEQTYLEKEELGTDDIIQGFLRKATDPKERGLQLYIAWNMVLLLCVLGSLKQRPKIFVALFILGNVLYVVYQAGVLLAYLYSMTMEEAMRLASYNRYHGTIIQYLVGVATAAILFSWKRAKTFEYALALLLIFTLSFPVMEGKLYTKLEPYTVQSMPYIDRLDQSVQDIEDPTAHAYTLYISPTWLAPEYVAFYARYSLDTTDVQVVYWVNDEDDFWDILDDSDVFIVLDENDDLRDWLEPFGERESYIGVF